MAGVETLTTDYHGPHHFPNRTVAAAQRPAAQLMEKLRLLHPVVDTDHEELLWTNGRSARTSLQFRQGMNKALQFPDLERTITYLPSSDPVRTPPP